MSLRAVIGCLTTILLLGACAFSPKRSADNSLRILFLGDIMAHQAQLDAAQQASGTHDFSAIFTKISPIFQEYDLVIANFETTLAGKPYSGYPKFSSPIPLATACHKAGIDIFLLANNHILDKGKRGLLQTVNKLQALQIPYLGVRKSHQEKKHLIYEKNGLRIGLLNYTQFTNGNSHSPLVNYLQKRAIIQDIARLKKENPDKIIVCVHWGKEYRNTPDNYQHKMGKFLLKQGADIIIGSHPHTIQPYNWDKQQDKLVAYSLGNFVSNQRTFPRDGGLMLGVSLDKTKENTTRICKVEPIPIWVEKYFIEQKAHYHILPAEDYAKNPQYFRYKVSYQKMKKFLRHSKKVLEPNF